MATPQTLHPGAAQGFANASDYDAHRPSYPAEAVSRFLEQLKVSGLNGAQVVDLAAGTGKFTELLAARPEGYDVAAVEPHEGMRAELERKGLARVEVKDGFAEKIPVTDEWADVVVVAQAFHWFATLEALSEIHRVVRRGGGLGMIWNIEDYNKPLEWAATTPWLQSLNELIWTLDGDGQARFRNGGWKAVFDEQLPSNPLKTVAKFVVPGVATADDAKAPLFSVPVGEDSVPFTVWLSREALWKRLRTLSQVAVLQGEDLTSFETRFDEILSHESVEKNEKGELAVHGKTYFAWSSRL